MTRLRNAKTSGVRRAGWLALAVTAITGAVLAVGGGGAFGASVTGASFAGGSGTVAVGTTLYAKQGGALTLTVTTDNPPNRPTRCVVISGAHASKQTSQNGKTSWTFTFTAGSGTGIQQITATAYRTVHPNTGNCTADSGENFGVQTASYVLDNTGPVVTGKKSPDANTAGWNRASVTIGWKASDDGSGVASGPTPASSSVSSDTTDAGVERTATATDRLGNVGTGSAVVKLDGTLPTIMGSRSPAANTAGWNNEDVIVSFLCSDAPSGINTCPSPTTLSSGANQYVSGKATDIAGNESAAAVVGPINVDKVAPTLSGAPTTAPDGDNGWYRGNVSIHWTCDDALSLPAGPCPADDTIAGEGENLTASASISDKAGNQTNATSSPAVKIDRTPPTTTASAVSGAWNNNDVTVTLDGDDKLSGPARTYFKVGAGDIQLYSSTSKPSFSQDGVYTLEFWTIDHAGNAEQHNSIDVKIDKTNPTIDHTLLPEANFAGWNNADTRVHFLCADPGGSGIKTVGGCTDDIVVIAEGFNPVTGTALDNAGNTASESFDVRVDKTPPSIVASADRAANTPGWYRDNVTVSFACADVKPAGVDHVSGLAVCPGAKTLGEGENQSAAGTATDTADNFASDAVTNIDVDKTSPTLTGTAKTGPNTNGWYADDVVVGWTCFDALSRIAGTCPADSTVGGEGDSLSASRSVGDVAGNTTDTTVGPIKIDRTAPSTSASVPSAPTGGWYSGDVKVTLTGIDLLSRIDKTFYSVDVGSAQEYTGAFDHKLKGIHEITFWSVDKAGNVEDRTDPGHSITLRIDGTPPSIEGTPLPGRNGFGWNNTTVTVSFACADLESGLASCEMPITLLNDGAGQSATGNATDVAGNTAQDTVADINIDTQPPTLSGAPTTSANGANWYRGDVVIDWTAEDGLSKIDPATEPPDSTITGEGSNLGAGPVSVSDKAGNSATASKSAIMIDRTAPVVSGAATTSANTAGWYRTDVIVAFSCVDPLPADGTVGSGIASCPSDKVIQGDGVGQSVTSAAATDIAGNSSAGKTVGSINIDGHEPQTTAATQCMAKNGYCKGATATVVLSSTDVGPSGVKEIRYKVNDGPEKSAVGATESVIVPLNGSGLANIVYWAIDHAGNVEPAGASELKYDNIAPTVTHTLDPTANAADWSKGDTTVHFNAIDDFSGVDAASVTPDVIVAVETSGRVVEGKADDMAGNTGTDSVTVKLDKTAPQVSGAPTASPGPGGWYSGPVTVHFTCSDALSLVAVCPDDVMLTANGADQSVQGTAIDHAANTKAATVSDIDIDATKPSIVVNGVESGRLYILGDVPAASCVATDGLSGVAGGCSVSVTGGLANGVGTFNYSATATDVAGNSTTVSGSYRVIYRWDGYLQPINDTAHQTDTVTSVFKAASTVPAKFQLRKANGTPVQANSLPSWLIPAKGGLTSVPVDEIVYSDPITTGASYRWDATAQQYIYNWGTAKNQAGYYWRIGVRLDDGQTYTVNIGLR